MYGGYFKDCVNLVDFSATGSPRNSEAYGLIHAFEMFSGCIKFDGDLSDYDVSNLVNLESMFQGATVFTGIGLDTWNTQNAQHMHYALAYTAVAAGLDNWDVSSVTTLNGFLKNNKAFVGEGQLSAWDTSSVNDLRAAFYGASKFQGEIGNWDVSR